MTSPAAGAEGPGQVTGGDAQPAGGSSTASQGKADQQGKAKDGATGNGHPAWAEYLKDIPAGLHGAVTPAFSKWDADMSAKLSQVQQQYAPFQSLLDAGKDPQRITAASELLDMIEEDPQGALAQLAMHFQVPGFEYGDGEEGDGGQGDGELGPSDQDGEELPSWAQGFQQQLQQSGEMLDLVAQWIVKNGQEAEQEAAVDQLESELTPLLDQAKIPYQGDQADDDALEFIFSQLANGKAPQEAVQRWTALQTKIGGQQASATAPQVLPAGGGLPTQQMDPTKPLSRNDRRAMAVQRAQQLMREGAGG